MKRYRSIQMKLLWAAAPLLIGQMAFAGPMNQAEFLALVGGDYKAVSPSPESLLELKTPVTIYENHGTIFLKNYLQVGTKNIAAVYKVETFECYNHEPQSTTCGFYMKLVNQGAFVHFLGVNPTVRVDRYNNMPKLEIRSDITLAREIERPPTIELEKVK